MTTLFSVKTRQKHRVSVSKIFPEKIFSNGTLLEINLAATFSGIVRKSQNSSHKRENLT